MWSSIVGALLGKVAPKVADYYIQKQTLKQEVELEVLRGKAAYEQAKTQRASESEGRDHDWEIESIRNSGWKDELVIIVLTIPMCFVFIPGLAPYVLEGFRVLETTPDWYRWLILMIYAATFGIRVWRRKL
jgi:hypothetical protein